jgi:hypothetical protein
MHRLLAILALSACTVVSANAPEAKVVKAGDEFDLSPSQSAVVDGGAVTLTFVKVNEDSRCPTDVQCVWAGDVAAAITLGVAGGEKSPTTIHTNIDPKTTIAGAYKVEVVNVKPARHSNTTIPQESYVVTFRATRQ